MGQTKQHVDKKKGDGKNKRPRIHDFMAKRQLKKEAKLEIKEKEEKEQEKKESFTKIDDSELKSNFDNQFEQMREITKKRRTEKFKDEDLYMEDTDQPLVESTQQQHSILDQVLKKEQERREYIKTHPKSLTNNDSPPTEPTKETKQATTTTTTNATEQTKESTSEHVMKKKKISILCEYVGVDELGTRQALGRVCIVGEDGKELYQKFVEPSEEIKDYRGLKQDDFQHAIPIIQIRKDLLKLKINKATIAGYHISRDAAILFNKDNAPSLDQLRDIALYDPLDCKPTGKSLWKRDSTDSDLQLLGAKYVGLDKNSLRDILTKSQVVLRIYKSFEKEFDAFYTSEEGKKILTESRYNKDKSQTATHDKRGRLLKKNVQEERDKEIEAKVAARQNMDNQIDFLLKQFKK
ncbi:RNA exonuclease [Acrasis kona]|uniref:RNA exonuclease n=1 Tax=Acrasis kona TaxID=1008807 RepID=A0AAW2YVX4_9EUKA